LIVFHFETLLRNLNLGVYNIGENMVEFQENNTQTEKFLFFLPPMMFS